MPYRSARLTPLLLVLLVLFVPILASAADWQPNETQVSAERELIDPEFNQLRQMLVWVDGSGRVWVASLDPDTGMLKTADGREVLVDPDAMKLGEAGFAFNGPEWALSSSTDQVTYTKFLPGRPRIGANARIAIARPLLDGTWSYSIMSRNLSRYIPYGSEDRVDPIQRITYIDPNGSHYWRETGKSNTEQPIPVPTVKDVPLRFVFGARAILMAVVVNGVKQVHYLDLDTQAVTQLTFDDDDKSSPFMWRAPEFGNEFMMFAVASNKMRFYRQLPDDTGALHWTSVREVVPPAGYLTRSPEPFTYAGRSYLYLSMTVQPNDFSSEIWVVGADPAQPVFQRITPDNPIMMRDDPEVFITSQGPRIYFNRYELRDGSACKPRWDCSQGLWLADPGLPRLP
jgi:hypothetical protein